MAKSPQSCCRHDHYGKRRHNNGSQKIILAIISLPLAVADVNHPRILSSLLVLQALAKKIGYKGKPKDISLGDSTPC